MKYKLTLVHVIFSVLIVALAWILDTSGVAYIHTALYGIVAFYFLQGLSINLTIDWVKGNYPEKISIFLLGSVVFRLLTSIIACIFALLIGIDDRQMFIINFFAVYFTYLIFELISLVANLRPNLESQ